MVEKSLPVGEKPPREEIEAGEHSDPSTVDEPSQGSSEEYQMETEEESDVSESSNIETR